MKSVALILSYTCIAMGIISFPPSNSGITNLLPESVTYHPASDQFIVSSIIHGAPFYVAQNGTTTQVGDSGTNLNTFGVNVDIDANILYTAMANFTPVLDAFEGKPIYGPYESVLVAYDLNTGEVAKRIPIFNEDVTAINDLAFDDDGNIYLTDILGAKIWKVSQDGHVGIFANDTARWNYRSLGVNGITVHNGYILTMTCDVAARNQLFKIHLRDPSHIIEVHYDGKIIASDGIRITADGSLIVTTHTQTTWLLQSKDNWETAAVTSSFSAGLDAKYSTVSAAFRNGQPWALQNSFVDLSIPDFIQEIQWKN
eukprot:TRINITY_DN2768_c0_g1_i1.p1 TRINITY_DN2768_c0_g1~~TRINITY_DN2768_c0_g1_i1.p1  ORF type:complete len:326 (-),score=63.77 TRINITY_DN2768_c0_g1_i1:40-978(-)